MYKNLKVKIILTLLILATCITVPISYAKYIANSSGIVKTEVATWNITINDKDINEIVEFDLFSTIDDNNVKDGIQAIAPGTNGIISLNIKNHSDVVAEYTINLEEISNENNIPILYSLEENGDYQQLSNLIIANNEEIGIDNDNTKNINIYWKWDFYKDVTQNEKDYELGISGNATIKLNMNIKINQKIN